SQGEGLTAGPYVTDDFGECDAPLALRRHVRAFFQGNRYLIRRLVDHVIGQVPAAGRVLDLYAGAGLFSVTAARRTGAAMTAVEGDRFAAEDLAANAGRAVATIKSDVESFLSTRADDSPFDAAIVDPPRTGLSREALDGLLGLKVARIVYVSCDVATLARDARAIVGVGYRVASAEAFDMFPNTPHVETVVVFDRTPG
ncbi:MAG TPA: RsmD family RNA methyltransferase, partial [Vicinamibacterales bacterium]